MSLVRALQFLRDAVSILLFGTVFVTLSCSVVARYVFSSPLEWADEFALVFFIQSIFWTCGFGLKLEDHFGFDVVYLLVSDRWKRVFLIAALGTAAAVIALSLPYVYDYVTFLARTETPALEWRFDLVFMCFPVFLAAFTIQIALKWARLFGRNWRAEI